MSDPKHLLSVPYRQQLSDGDCLAACVAMVLAYWQRDIDYPALLRLLNIKAHGARASNVLRLAHASQLRVQVAYSATDLTGLMHLVLAGQPVIAFVRTGELPSGVVASVLLKVGSLGQRPSLTLQCEADDSLQVTLRAGQKSGTASLYSFSGSIVCPAVTLAGTSRPLNCP